MPHHTRASGVPLREVFEKNPVPMWVYDFESLAFLAVNEAAVRQYGYSREEFLAMTIREIRPPEEIPALLEKVSRLREEFSAARIWRHRRKDGTIIDVEVTSHQINYNGIGARLVLANDVTARRWIEEALVRKDHILSEAQRIGHIGSWDADFVTGKILWSDELHRIYGTNPETFEPSAAPFFQIVHRDDRKAMAAWIRATSAGEAQEHLDFRVVWPDGTLRWVRGSVEPIVAVGGRAVGAIGTGQDITESKRAELALLEQKAFTENLIRNSSVATFVLDARHEVLIWNRACEELTGVAATSMIGSTEAWKPFYDAPRPVLADLVLDPDPEKLSRLYPSPSCSVLMPEGLHAERWVEDLNGKDRYIIFDAAPIRDSAGMLVAAIETIQDFTSHKLAEEASEASEARYRDLFDNAGDMIQSVAADGRFLYVNPAWRKVLGYREDEVRSLTLFDVVHPGCRRSCEEHFRKVMSGEPIGFLETQFVAKDGRVVDLEGSAGVCRDGGRVVSSQGIFRDVTERKKLQEELWRVSHDWEETFNTISDMVTVHDNDFNIVLANEAAKKSLRLPLIGKQQVKCFDYYHGTGCPPQSCPSCVSLVTGKPSVAEHYEPHLGRYLEVRAIPRTNSDNQVVGLIHIVRDITERKHAEAERDRLSVAIEQAGETVLVTDALGTIQYVNPVFEAVTGYTHAEVIGENPRLLKSGEQDTAFYRELWETITSGRVWKGRLVNRRKDGILFTEEATISPVRDETGRIVSFVAVKRDITEQLHAAEEKARLEDQLRQSQKVEALGQLAGGVAHDFNNLTAIVLGYGEMLLEKLPAADSARAWAEQIVAAGRRSAALTRQLLAFSRKQTLQPEVLDLNALLRNFEKMLGRLIGENIALEIRLAAEVGRVLADPGQIEQVVANLAVNARDAMPRGGRLTVETADVELDATYALGHERIVPGWYVMLTLSDTGCGFDKATKARIFEPFYTTKERGRGTGLGLATAYGIVKQSGGYIYAYAEPGLGATFKIYLPRTGAKPAAKTTETPKSVLRGGGERILLVEDEDSLRELCATLLTDFGYRVNAAANGTAAQRLVRDGGFEPDLLLTDVIMPGMSGAELARQLSEGRPGLRVLYMSGYTDHALGPHGVLAPGTHFIQKPFVARDLSAKVRETLDGKAPGSGSRDPRSEPGSGLARRVLMVDDDEQFRELVQHFCAKRGHVFTGVDSAAAALTALAARPCDVLLLDLNIPGTSGEHVLREIRAAGHALPAIVLTGGPATAEMAVLRQLGTVGLVEKSSDSGPLLLAIEAAALAAGPLQEGPA